MAETAKFLHEQDGAEPLLEVETRVPGRALSRPLSPGTRVSRYVVTDVLGVGGAGVVYRAHDPQLRRDIALKLLRPDHSASSWEPRASTARDASRRSAALEARLLREARAMARLSHPNVVTVFDVGLYEGQVFLVMELVEGETLDEWLGRPRTLEERVAKFIEAGRGLAAAHAEHIAHRDFKPANVLVGADGRVRVTDFGLARACSLAGECELTGGGAAAEQRAATALETGRQYRAGLLSPVEVSSARTRRELSFATATEGALAGTPAFMAPEQFLRAGTDARTDQFSFCVALYRAAYGCAPFQGHSLEELAAAVTAGRLREPPADSPAPPRLYAALRRGLAVDPAQRYPTMAALLGELGAVLARDDDRAHRAPPAAVGWRRPGFVPARWLTAAAAVLSLVAAGLVLSRAQPDRAAERAVLTPVAVAATDVVAAPAPRPTEAAVAARPHAAAEAPRAPAPRPARRAVRQRAERPRKQRPATPITLRGERLDDRLKDPF